MPKNALAPTPINALDLAVAQQFGLQPNMDRLSVLPRYSAQTGWVAPEMVYQAARAFTAPSVAAQGYALGPEEALNVAMTAMGGSAPARTPANALRMGLAQTEPAMVSAERLARERKYYGYPDNSSKGILVKMSPEKFLSLAAEGGDDVLARAKQMKRFDVSKLNEEFLPYLDITKRDGFDTVVNHEGRARAMRALMDNVPEIPVVISTRGERFKSASELPSMLASQNKKVGLTPIYKDVRPIELLAREAK